MVLGLFGESKAGYKAPKVSFEQKVKNFGHTVIDSRCVIIKYVLSMLIVTILLFIVKRYWFKISHESPIMSDFFLTFALVGVTLGLKAATAAGLALFAPLKCPSREEQMSARGWLPPPTNDAQSAAYKAYAAALNTTQ